MKFTRALAVTLMAIDCLRPVHVGAAQLSLSGNFEGTKQEGRFVYEKNDVGLSINYYSPSLRRKLTFFISKFDECSSMAMYRIPNTRQVVIDGSCMSQGGQIYKNFYEWKEKYSNWCLIKEVRGERADQNIGKLAPSEEVSRFSNCTQI
jgi:hypothetical protein